LYAAAQPRVFAYIFTLVGDWNDSEEILQETSLALWQSFDDFQPGTNFRAWACKIAFYQVLSYRKRKKRTPFPMGQGVMEAVAEETDDLTDVLDEQLLALSRCVNKLQERDRSLLDHFYGMGVSATRIAAQFGRPVGTITKSLTRIRRTLFACVERTLATEEQG
jgi:RNA polymerase sigma-70 factor (ECF subfamily)